MDLSELRKRVIETHPDKIGPTKLHIELSTRYNRLLRIQKNKKILTGLDKEIYDLICAYPGIKTSRIADNLRRPLKGLLISRIKRLERFKFITGRKIRFSRENNLHWYILNIQDKDKLIESGAKPS